MKNKTVSQYLIMFMILKSALQRSIQRWYKSRRVQSLSPEVWSQSASMLTRSTTHKVSVVIVITAKVVRNRRPNANIQIGNSMREEFVRLVTWGTSSTRNHNKTRKRKSRSRNKSYFENLLLRFKLKTSIKLSSLIKI